MKMKKIGKYILGIFFLTLILLVSLYLRYLTTEDAAWPSPAFLYPFVWPFKFLCFISDGTLLMDIALSLIIYLAALLVPADGPYQGWRRYLLRPVIAVVVFVLLRIPTWGMICQFSDRSFHAGNAGKYQQIRETIDESEYALLYFGGSHATEALSEHLPQLTFRGNKTYSNGQPVYYATDALLIDLDIPTLTFCDYGGPHDPTYQTMTFRLEPADVPPVQYDWSRTHSIRNTCKLVYYFTGEENLYGGDYTIRYITLQMPDGTLWITSDLIDPKTGENYDIWLYPHAGYHVITDFDTQKPASPIP